MSQFGEKGLRGRGHGQQVGGAGGDVAGSFVPTQGYGHRVNLLRPSADPAVAVEQLRGWLAAARPPQLLIETSGSTGRPKRVLLTRDAVLASVRASAARVGSGRWSLRLPADYIAGVQVIVRSLSAGHEPVLDAWSDEGGSADCTSLVGTQLHRMLGNPEDVAALAAMRVVLVGGGPVDAGDRAAAEAAGIRVVATYGASETAGGCVYDGLPLDGVAVALGSDGRIRLGGPTIFSGYEGDPELTEKTLTEGWYLTQDAGRLDEDGHLQVLGRIDDVALTGGVKVPLPAVAGTLRTHPAVGLVEVLAVEDVEWGQRVVAFVQPKGAAPTLVEVRDFVALRHPRSWAPRDLVICAAFPLLANGKIDRMQLRAEYVEGGG